MKKIKHFLIGLILLSSRGFAQTGGTQNGYIEWNVGLAYLIYGTAFPGTSVLIGTRLDFKNNLLLDVEAGVALPGYGTGKLGIGSYIDKENKSAFFVGIRPWPMHVYLQINMPETKIGQCIISGELGNGSETSLYSMAIFNFGYRWKLKR